MPDACETMQRVPQKQFIQIRNFARCTTTIKFTILNRRNARTVISPVLKSLQRCNQTGSDIRCSDNTDNSAHMFIRS
jgi:hypothetical protein